jgi:hypothetical protein
MANSKSNTNTNTPNDTPELDKKKQQLNAGSITATKSINNIGSFLISILITVLLIVGYFIFGSIILYECKLAQSNIMPTNLECYPYTEANLEIHPVSTNIFITNTEPPESVKLSFPYDKYNSKNIFLDFFRKYKEQPRSNFLINYIIAILEGLINYSNNALTSFFNLLNGLPEILIIIFGPIFSTIYFGLVPIVGIFVFIYHYFSEMSWFFKENTSTNSNKPNWTNINLFEPVIYGSALFLVFIFFILFWILLFTITPILSIIIFYICFFMSLAYKGEIDGKKITIFTIIQDIFKYYKVTMTIIISVMIVLSAYSHLGVLPGVFSILTVLLIYFKFIPINIFESIKATNLSPLSSFEQATKKCNPVHGYKPKTFSELFGNFFDVNQKGGGIGRELKKLNKKINK